MESLYVGDLHADVTESDLFNKFSIVGPIISIRVCRNEISGQSLGYGYIHFQNLYDAVIALDTFNFDIIKGRPIRILWSERDPALHKSSLGNIFIKNLDHQFDNKLMSAIFAAYGNIVSCKIAQDKNGKPKSFGVVQYESERAAKIVIDKINGIMLFDKKVLAGLYIPRREREEELITKAYVFVKNLNDDITDELLREMFEKYGPISSLKIVTRDSKSRCFGFVGFESLESAKNAVQYLNQKELANGKILYVRRIQPKAMQLEELQNKSAELRRDRLVHYQGTPKVQQMRAPPVCSNTMQLDPASSQRPVLVYTHGRIWHIVFNERVRNVPAHLVTAAPVAV